MEENKNQSTGNKDEQYGSAAITIRDIESQAYDDINQLGSIRPSSATNQIQVSSNHIESFHEEMPGLSQHMTS